MNVSPRVFTISPSAPFLRVLARGILDGVVVPGFLPRANAELLASATIYLPTRRAARVLADIFLEEAKTSALLLPRIVPLGDVDEDAFAFEPGDLAAIAPAVPSGERRLALAKLIAGYAGADPRLLPASPAIAIALADELAHLMDDFITAGLHFADAQKAVDGEFDRYWERSREFLAIVDQGWNGFLEESGKIDSATRRDLLLEREAERLARSAGGPVIAAGSTGTLPKVANLLRVIASRSNGAVVLPGLDQGLDDDSFSMIAANDDHMPGHPQYGLKRLLEKIGIHRDAVIPLGKSVYPQREEILSLAFRPQPSGDISRRLAQPNSLTGIAVIEADNAREEALAIAIALREALHEQKSAALVTPDRALARRVCAELTRWEIDIDDSAGLPLADSEAGRLARLVVMAAESEAAPSTLLALLHHPFLRASFEIENIELFELSCLRGARPSGGFSALPGVIEEAQPQEYHASDPRARFDPSQWDRAKTVARTLADMLSPLLALTKGTPAFVEIAQAHLAVLSILLGDNTQEGSEEIVAALEELAVNGRQASAMSLAEYAESFPAMIREITLRPARSENERLRILGPLEARMISVDRMVLGGLCEGTWPPEAHTDSWLNRPMRKQMGLDLPERRIGLSAHDFVQAASSKELFLTRARKQGGVETIASRFLQRVAAVADHTDWTHAKDEGNKYLRWARTLEDAPRAETVAAPAPRPPVTARPQRFSMSDMRDLTRDPYSIYARKILNLRRLEPIDAEPGHAERGTLLHSILAEFAARHPAMLPASAHDDLIEIGRQAFAPMQNYPAVFAIWWPRFARAAKWFVEEERKRRDRIARIYSEVSGSLEINVNGRTSILTARADRIEVNKDGTIAVLDFKTGTLPTYKEAILGFEPQLLLEAAIAKAGGFQDVDSARLAEVGPIRISGGQPPGEFKLFALSNHKDFKAVSEPRGILGENHLDIAADYARLGAEKLLTEYFDQNTAYPFAPRVQWQKDYNDYEHLARYKEWSEGE